MYAGHTGRVVAQLDISFLSPSLRAAARYTNGGREVMWPRGCVAEVVNAMADQGLVVLGLDLRSDGGGVTPAGLATEVPWSAYQRDRFPRTDPVEGGRADALLALARPNLGEFADYPWILITWVDLTSFRGVIEKDG
jgi:hypothetical protein